MCLMGGSRATALTPMDFYFGAMFKTLFALRKFLNIVHSTRTSAAAVSSVTFATSNAPRLKLTIALLA